jgi:hypothetical protein
MWGATTQTTGTFILECTCGRKVEVPVIKTAFQCPRCTKWWHMTAGGKPVGTDDTGHVIRVSEIPSVSTREKLAAEWEATTQLIPDGALKEFICLAIKLAMESWAGGEPPRPRVLTVEVVTAAPHECEFQHSVKKGAKCIHCGKGIEEVWPSGWKDKDFKSGPISPFAGFNIPW